MTSSEGDIGDHRGESILHSQLVSTPIACIGKLVRASSEARRNNFEGHASALGSLATTLGREL